MNIGGSPTTATFTFRTTANTTVTATLWLPAQCRATLYANAVPGLSAASFRTTVTASVYVAAPGDNVAIAGWKFH